MASFLDRASELIQRFTKRAPADRRQPELGWGGARISAGLVSEEHNADLQGLKGIQAATKMRRTDAMVRAVEKVISLPIRSTSWYLEEPKGAGSAEKEAKELLEANLFGGMEHSWDDLLREACLAIYYGWRVPEIVWEEREGVLAIAKLASRNLELVDRWLYDEEGRLVGYLYVGNRPWGQGLTDLGGGTVRHTRVPVPIEKTVHFAYDAEDENPQGFGLWRSMYPHYYIKQALYRIIGIGIERNLLPVPVGKLQPGAQEKDQKAFKSLLSRWRAAEDAAVVLYEGQHLEFAESQRSLMDAMPFLQHQDAKIAQAGLAQFLNLGQTSVGTQSLASEHTKLFLDAEEANARWIEQTINAQLVRRWCLLNYGDKLKCPLVRHKKISARDIGTWTAALNQLVSGGIVHPTVDDEEKVRDEFELPAIPREQLISLEQERLAAEKQKQEAELAAMAAKAAPAPAAGPVKASEPAGDCEHFDEGRSEGDVEELRRGREETEQSFSERAQSHLVTIQEGYLAALRPLVEEAEASEKIAQGKPLSALADVAVPGARRYQEFVRGFLWDVFREGQSAVASETGDEAADRPVSNKLRQWISARAAVIAASHVGQLRTAVLERVLTGIRAEMPTAEIFSDAGAVAIDELSRNVQRDWHATAAEVLTLID